MTTLGLLDTLAVAARIDDLIPADVTWNLYATPDGLLVYLSGTDVVASKKAALDIAERLDLNPARSTDPLKSKWLGHGWVGEGDTARVVPVHLEQVHASLGTETAA